MNVFKIYVKLMDVCLYFQFIVVSLKDGMFNNANVLFRTKFVDGVSTVTRFAQNETRPGGSSSNIMTKKAPRPKPGSKRLRVDDD